MFSLQTVRLKTIAAVAAGATLASSSAAFAGTNTATFNVTANVAQQCTLAVGNVAFGAYDPQAATFAKGAVTITCNVPYPDNTAPTVAVNYGSNNGAAWYMRNAGAANNNYLNYLLCEDAACTTPWPTTGVGAALPNVNAALTQWTGFIYGEITAGHVVAAGNYTDTVTATVTF
jgi:spore coat protein U-like protein